MYLFNNKYTNLVKNSAKPYIGSIWFDYRGIYKTYFCFRHHIVARLLY